MIGNERRGGVGSGSGRALIQAGLTCLVAAGCATDPPPALITVVDPQRLVVHDSELLPDTAKARMRTYLASRAIGSLRSRPDPTLDEILSRDGGTKAVLDESALPEAGETAAVTVEVPGAGGLVFRISRVDSETGPQYTGHVKGEPITILIVRDSLHRGRITTPAGTYNFRSLRYGLIDIAPIDRTGVLPELHLLGAADLSPVTRTDCDAHDPSTLEMAEEC